MIMERSSERSSHEKDPRYNEANAGVLTRMECMLIASYGQEHDPETKAIPKEEMDLNEISTRIEGLKLTDEGGGAYTTESQIVQRLLNEDKLKTLKYEFEETGYNQRSRQLYIDKIINLFQNCQEPGGTCIVLAMWFEGGGIYNFPSHQTCEVAKKTKRSLFKLSCLHCCLLLIYWQFPTLCSLYMHNLQFDCCTVIYINTMCSMQPLLQSARMHS